MCIALDALDSFRLSCHLCVVRLLSRLFVQCRGLRLSCFHPSVVATNALPQLSRGARPQLSQGHASRMRSCLLRASSLLSCTGFSLMHSSMLVCLRSHPFRSPSYGECLLPHSTSASTSSTPCPKSSSSRSSWP